MRTASRSRTPQHLNGAARAPVDGEATFVVGNPGSTQRMFTSDQLAFQRELVLPITRHHLLRASRPADRGDGIEPGEGARRPAETLGGIENSLKVYIGRVKALNDPAFTGKLAAAEAELKAKSAGNAAIGNPWGDVAKAMRAYRDFYVADRFSLPPGDLFGYAMTLVRAAAERAKPNADRFPGYSDSRAAAGAEKRCSTSGRSIPGSTS